MSAAAAGHLPAAGTCGGRRQLIKGAASRSTTPRRATLCCRATHDTQGTVSAAPTGTPTHQPAPEAYVGRNGSAAFQTVADPQEAAAAAPAGGGTGSPLDWLLASPGLERAEGSDPAQMLRVTEAFWKGMRSGKAQGGGGKAAEVVRRLQGRVGVTPEFDVCVCGGTLGVLLALALQQRGLKVCIVEKRVLEGRTQEWNISRAELSGLVSCGLLSWQELEACIATCFNPVRVGVKGMAQDIWVRDVLNLGVSPRTLLALLRSKFLAAGGTLLEHHAFKAAQVWDDGVEVQLGPAAKGAAAAVMELGDVNRPTAVRSDAAHAAPGNGAAAKAGGSGGGDGRAAQQQEQRRRLSARLLIDCMGHYSSIARQMRGGQRPDGMVLVVGGAFEGMPAERNTSGDLLYTLEDASDDLQMFWEAFPAARGLRTAYMFAYSDAEPQRPSFTQLLHMYLQQLPKYQGLPLEQMRFRRLLMGGFPCYFGSPLRPAWDRVLQIGDASASQSPLSFGGFGSMVRHLPRLIEGVSEALQGEHLSRRQLGWLQPYQPALSVAWLLQRSMSVGVGQLGGAAQQRIPDPPATACNSTTTTTSSSNSSSSVPAAGAPQQQAGQLQQQAAAVAPWRRLPPGHVNRLLRCNFSVMRLLGDRALRPFLQDTMQLGPLAATMLGMSLRDPLVVTRVVLHIGPRMLLGWFFHFAALAACTLLHAVLAPLKPFVRWYAFRRLLDALRWGTGSDYHYHGPKQEQRQEGAQEATAAAAQAI